MENNNKISISINFNNVTENIIINKEFDEFKNILNEKFNIKEEDFKKLLLYYIDEENDKITIQNSSDYSQFYKDCKNNNEISSIYIKENENNNYSLFNNNNNNNNDNYNNINNKEEMKEQNIKSEDKYKYSLLCLMCNSNIINEPFYYCPKCKEYFCPNCFNKLSSNHRHVIYIINNKNQYFDLLEIINDKNKKKKKKSKLSNIVEKISKAIFDQKSDSDKIKMCKKIYNLEGVSDEKILDALNKCDGNPERIIEFLF